MWARIACCARIRRSSDGSTPSGSISRSNRARNACRPGLVRSVLLAVRLQEISAAIRWLMFLVFVVGITPSPCGLLEATWRVVPSFVPSSRSVRLRAETRAGGGTGRAVGRSFIATTHADTRRASDHGSPVRRGPIRRALEGAGIASCASFQSWP